MAAKDLAHIPASAPGAWIVTADLAAFQVNDDLVAKARPEVIVMHCLPAQRDIEVTDAVMESTASIVFDEAENRMHAQDAILLKICGKA